MSAERQQLRKSGSGADASQNGISLSSIASKRLEEELIGAILRDPEMALPMGIDEIQEEWFFHPVPRLIWREIAKALGKGHLPDVSEIGSVLVDRVEALTLAAMMEQVHSASTVDRRMEGVRDLYLKRNLQSGAVEAISDLKDATLPSSVARDVLDDTVRRHDQEGSAVEVKPLGDLLRPLGKRIAAGQQTIASPIETGLDELDRMLGGGLSPGGLHLLAARPSMGKSTLAVNIAIQAAATGHPSLLFSLEDSSQEIAVSVLAREIGVNKQRIRRHDLDSLSRDAAVEAANLMADLPMFVADPDSLTVSKLHSTARRMVYRHGVELIVLDYLQLMVPPEKVERREEQVAILSRSCKYLARSLKVPLLVLSQLNRSVDSRDHHIPRLSDLRESGSLEQDADSVMFLVRQGYYNPKLREDEQIDGVSKTQLILAKQRNGPVGEISLAFNLEAARFSTWHEPGLDPVMRGYE